MTAIERKETRCSPIDDQETTALRLLAHEMAARAKAMVVNDRASSDAANDFGARAATCLRSVEKRRKSFVQPLNADVRDYNALFKGIAAPLVEAKAILGRKILGWRMEERRRIDDARFKAEVEVRDAEREAREKDMAAEKAWVEGNSKKAAELERSATTAQNKADTSATTAAALVGAGPPKAMDAGGVKNKTSVVWDFRVTNPTEVPREHLAVNEKSIRAAVAKGARDIPGVRIFQKERLSFASKR